MPTADEVLESKLVSISHNYWEDQDKLCYYTRTNAGMQIGTYTFKYYINTHNLPYRLNCHFVVKDLQVKIDVFV